MAAGSNRIAVGWTLAVICWILAIAMLTMPTSADGAIGGFGCCSLVGFAFLGLVDSGKKARKASTKSQAQWAMEARNFEVALNWDKAADSYEKAGLFEEAGRVRKVQMEKSGAGVNIHVKSGDTYHDSVVMKDDDKPL